MESPRKDGRRGKCETVFWERRVDPAPFAPGGAGRVSVSQARRIRRQETANPSSSLPTDILECACLAVPWPCRSFSVTCRAMVAPCCRRPCLAVPSVTCLDGGTFFFILIGIMTFIHSSYPALPPTSYMLNSVMKSCFRATTVKGHGSWLWLCSKFPPRPQVTHTLILSSSRPRSGASPPPPSTPLPLIPSPVQGREEFRIRSRIY